MDLLAMSSNGDVSSWVSFDDQSSPITPSDEFLSPSFFASSAALTGASLLDASTSILCKDDDTLNDLSFDWPHKSVSLSADSDFSGMNLLDNSFQAPKQIYNDVCPSVHDLQNNAAATAAAIAAAINSNNLSAATAILAAQQQQNQQPQQQQRQLQPQQMNKKMFTNLTFADMTGADLDSDPSLSQFVSMQAQRRMRLSPEMQSFSSASSISSASSSEFSTPMSSPSLTYYPSNNNAFSAAPSLTSPACSPIPPVSLSGNSDSSVSLAMAVAAAAASSLKAGQPSNGAAPVRPPRAPRKQSESRIPLPDLHARMGLAQDPDEARSREQHILGILQDQGFPLGERTWIRDTEEKERRRIIEEIYKQTYELYGYERSLLEVIVRRGAYYLMQGRLRRLRRSKRHHANANGTSSESSVTGDSGSEATNNIAEEEDHSSRSGSEEADLKEDEMEDE
ncbi:hypothetical protein BZA70DRAFT_274716 [Myxozyma melibiosi]|uniref:Uncharacterized protein n=1 Tax=Myxozyma melibiosi TaxID=54550 RepID=A0ABR1FBV8_9ASCO